MYVQITTKHLKLARLAGENPLALAIESKLVDHDPDVRAFVTPDIAVYYNGRLYRGQHTKRSLAFVQAFARGEDVQPARFRISFSVPGRGGLHCRRTAGCIARAGGACTAACQFADSDKNNY